MDKRRFTQNEYGRPEKGSKSEYRALLAARQVNNELRELCDIVYRKGESYTSSNQEKCIEFSVLFEIYASISNKLVGMLVRAKKLKIINFEGEVLFQGRDDRVKIYLLKKIEDIRKMFKEKLMEIEAAITETLRIQESQKNKSSSDDSD